MLYVRVRRETPAAWDGSAPREEGAWALEADGDNLSLAKTARPEPQQVE